MVKYTLEFKQSAQKELNVLDDGVFTRIDRKILALADNPRPAGCKRLKGPVAHPSQWLARAYIIDDAGKLVTITRIAHRREVYE